MTKDLYTYKIKYLSIGIVNVSEEEDTRRKVHEAYSKHNDCFNSYDDVN